MIRWFNILVPVVAALAAGRFVSIAFWDASKQGLLVALSVIAAGVLVRLARGLPFTTPDHYEVDEIRKLTKAVEQIMRSLRALITLTLAGMVALVLAKPVLEFASSISQISKYASNIEALLSGIIGL